MPDIPNVGIRGIQPVKIHSWMIQPPVVSAIEVPVTVNIGTPPVPTTDVSRQSSFIK